MRGIFSRNPSPRYGDSKVKLYNGGPKASIFRWSNSPPSIHLSARAHRIGVPMNRFNNLKKTCGDFHLFLAKRYLVAGIIYRSFHHGSVSRYPGGTYIPVSPSKFAGGAAPSGRRALSCRQYPTRDSGGWGLCHWLRTGIYLFWPVPSFLFSLRSNVVELLRMSSLSRTSKSWALRV